MPRRHRRAARAERSNDARLASEECLQDGVTSFQDAGSSLADVDLLRGLAERGKLRVRLWVMLNDGNDVLRGELADTAR